MYETLIIHYLTFDAGGRYTGTGAAEVEIEDPDLTTVDGVDSTRYAATLAILNREERLPEGSQVAVTSMTRPEPR